MFLAGPRDVNEVFVLVKDNIDFYSLFTKAVELIATHTRTPENLNRLIDRIEGLPQTERTTAEYRDWLESELNGIQAELTAVIDPAPVPAPVPARRRAVSSRQQVIDAMEEKEASAPDAEFGEPALGSDEPALGSDEPALGSDEPALGYDEPALGYDEPATELDTLVAVAAAAAAVEATLPVPSPSAVELASIPATRKGPRVTLTDPLAASLAPADTPVDEPTVPTSPATATSPTASTEGQLGPSGDSTKRARFGPAVISPPPTERPKGPAALARIAARSAAQPTPAQLASVTPASAAALRISYPPATATSGGKRPSDSAGERARKRIRTPDEEEEGEGEESEEPLPAPANRVTKANRTTRAASEEYQYASQHTEQAHVVALDRLRSAVLLTSDIKNARMGMQGDLKSRLKAVMSSKRPNANNSDTFKEFFKPIPPTELQRQALGAVEVPSIHTAIYHYKKKDWRYLLAHSADSASSPDMCMELEVCAQSMSCQVWSSLSRLSTESMAQLAHRVLQLAQVMDFLIMAKHNESGEGLPGISCIDILQFNDSDTKLLDPLFCLHVGREICKTQATDESWYIKISVANVKLLYRKYREMISKGKSRNI